MKHADKLAIGTFVALVVAAVCLQPSMRADTPTATARVAIPRPPPVTAPPELITAPVGLVVNSDKPEVIVLTKENTISFSDVVTEASVAQFQVQLQEMSNRLPKSRDIIVVLNTPGGDVVAGNTMIDSVRAVPQKVKTLTIFAASMGFHFAQAFDERMVTPTGVLMSHRAKGGLSGEFDGEFDVRLAAIKRQLDYLSAMSAKRLGMSLEVYKELIRDEYWVHGFDSVSEKAADRVVLARCDNTLAGTKQVALRTMFGNIAVTLSNCPLITGPLGIGMSGVGEEHEKDVQDYIHKLFYAPRDFVETYIVTNKFYNFVR